MKKLFLIIITYSIPFFAQNDIRGVKWGSTIDEVLISEKPNSPSKVYDDQIRYDRINIGNNVFSKIIYYFTNGKLSKVYYNIYSDVGDCEYMLPLTLRYLNFKFIFDILESKGYVWHPSISNWVFDGYLYPNIDKAILTEYFRNKFHGDMELKPEYNLNNFNFETLDNIDLIGRNIFSTSTIVHMLNFRTDLTITFPTILNKKEDYCNQIWMKEENTFNKVIILKFEPNEEVKKQIYKSNF
jgi:hypothetical protein